MSATAPSARTAFDFGTVPVPSDTVSVGSVNSRLRCLVIEGTAVRIRETAVLSLATPQRFRGCRFALCARAYRRRLLILLTIRVRGIGGFLVNSPFSQARQ